MNAKYGSMKHPAKSCWDIFIETRNVDVKKEYFIDPNGGSALDRISVTCRATEDGAGYYTCIKPARKNSGDTRFSYGYDGMADRQLSSLASLSNKATQSISTSQTTLIGWNGKEITNTASNNLMMTSVSEDNVLTLSTYTPSILPFAALSSPNSDEDFHLSEVCFA